MRIQPAINKISSKTQSRAQLNTKYSIIALYVALSVVYLTVVLLLPADKKVLTRYQISPAAVKIISSVVALPLVAIWGIGFYAYYRYNNYVASIRKTKDGAAHQLIATGLLVLALGLPINSITSNLLTYYGRHNPDFLSASVIIANYVAIILYMAAFAPIYRGVNRLLHITRNTPRTREEIYLMVLFTIIVGIFFYLSLHNPARQFATTQVTTAAFYLPDWLIILTILIPYTVTWYMGLISAYRFWLYRNDVKGKLYRGAFTRLAAGLASVVLLLMILRYLTALVTILDKLTLKYLLLIVYILLIFIAVGNILIASGAKRLMKIEEV